MMSLLYGRCRRGFEFRLLVLGLADVILAFVLMHLVDHEFEQLRTVEESDPDGLEIN